jgi:glucose/arabinose dehydrogenase
VIDPHGLTTAAVRRGTVVLCLVASVALAACDAASRSVATPSVSGTTTTAQPSDLADVKIHLEPVATLDQPLGLAVRSGDPALYVAEKTGQVVAIHDGKLDPVPVLDIGDEISLGGEQGLLGLAFSPDGRYLYVNFTDVNGNTHVVAFAMRDGRAAPDSRREILSVAQPYSNHNGGDLVFGPDGYLYIGLGDGGSGGDPEGNGQSLSTLLGKMLRIDPTPTGPDPYEIPADNPFVDREGARGEIWAYGLRNPWRYSFDRATGDLWIGDVGQSAWEEVDRQSAGSPTGQNYGWNLLEGTHPYSGDDVPADTLAPVYEYSHNAGGCVVTGGYVYRGAIIPALVGTYVFADFCLGSLEGLRVAGGRTEYAQLGPTVSNISSFGQDASGELYALSLAGPVYRLAPGAG